MPKPKFVFEIVSSCSHTVQTSKVDSLVNDLLDKGYQVEVIVHPPIPEQNPEAKFYMIVYNTTVIATMTDEVSIKQTK